ncbi:MAG: hypothetical protein A4E53_04627 [Pelotomaculum sp. PtaB.Bin104]|nr:MAG: hypothetical protein A4E53_04627 [Pelotomaculum sp. PtaB.Bin104]
MINNNNIIKTHYELLVQFSNNLLNIAKSLDDFREVLINCKKSYNIF